MKQKPTRNKSEKFEEESYFKQQDHKDKERKGKVDALYKGRSLPKTRTIPRNKTK